MNIPRPELPPLPARMKSLPVVRGYPVPWFVQWIEGEPEFRIMDGQKLVRAVRDRLCWVCGQSLGAHLAFTIGPMCAVNRISAEPPSHRECSIFSARGCPFLTRPAMRRREHDYPDDAQKPGGIMLDRNPGVALVWITKRYTVIPQRKQSPLFRIGDPLDVLAFAHGAPATKDEIRASVLSGLPALFEAADPQGPAAVEELNTEVLAACTLLKIPPFPHMYPTLQPE